MAITVHTRLQLLRIEKEKLNAELAFLKAQINPHFLFNTLNSIYSLAIQKSDKTAETGVRLSEMMRYIIKDAKHNQIALEKEMEYISNYDELQKSRLGDTVSINSQIEGSCKGKYIAPLFLITFIEDAFKYGVNPDEDSQIIIKTSIGENELLLQIFNNKVKTFAYDEPNGIGINNTRERLQLLYPRKHRLQIQDTSQTFSVDLSIQLS